MPTNTTHRSYPAPAAGDFLRDGAATIKDGFDGVDGDVNNLFNAFQLVEATTASNSPSDGVLSTLTIPAVPYARRVTFNGVAVVTQDSAAAEWDFLIDVTVFSGGGISTRWSQSKWSEQLRTKPRTLPANTAITGTMKVSRASGSGGYVHLATRAQFWAEIHRTS
ncbi:hypothetical protein [Jannaschia sp. R86511]|uniref:hypothetical protein n=1 Tax=Jannaschia sp. R86511 TaxID=3093853 RepID=UPI0036D36044